MALSEQDKVLIKSVRDRLRVTKVVCTRALKTKNGDFFVGFSAAWDTTQEDAGGMGTDLIDGLEKGEAQVAAETRGMTLKEAKIAGYLLAMQTDLQAQDHALAGGGISKGDYDTAQKAVRRNYMKLMADALASSNGNGDA
jgi:hypothetical protein